MSSLLHPLHLLLMMFAGWVNRHQLDVIDYLQEENRVLKERLGERRIRFTDAERRRVARKAHVLGRKALNGVDSFRLRSESRIATTKSPGGSTENNYQPRSSDSFNVQQVMSNRVMHAS